MSDLKQYWQELAKKAGISDDKSKLILEALGDESVQKAFAEGFVETPRHHSTLDRTVGEYKGKLTDAEKAAKELRDWYEKTGKPAHDWAMNQQAVLKQYEATYGPIEGSADRRAAAVATGMTKEEVDALLRQRDAAYVSVAKDIAWASGDYSSRFKEPLDIDAVEKAALEKGIPFRQAYRESIQPRLEAATNAEWEAKVKAAREEGARDALSKHKLPVDTQPREPHPFFEAKSENGKLNESQQDSASRDAFMEGWNNPNQSAAA